MSNACTPILVGVAIPASEILLLSKTAKIPLLTMDYVQVYAYACVYNILLRYQCLAVSNCCACTIAWQNFALPLSCTTCEY